VDASAVVVLFAIFGALLAICGLGLVSVGIGMLIEGTGAGVLGVVLDFSSRMARICSSGLPFGCCVIFMSTH
jgi:hypothetical protein